MHTPNLFSFATKELSQDAFICWLLSWGDSSYSSDHVKLNSTACHMLDMLFALGKVSKPAAYKKVVVTRQVHKIDVLVVVNEEYAIIIEDKTFTKDHSQQLDRYLAEVRKQYPREKIAAIYLKTGDQSSYKSVTDSEYACFSRQHFLEVLQYGIHVDVKNDIFLDYQQNLTKHDADVQSFLTKPIKPADIWDWKCWTGFFLKLQEFLNDDSEWDYVSNKKGGFMGFWWHWKESKYYLQLEENELCFKIAVDDKTQQASEWEQWHAQLMNVSKQNDMVLVRPRRRNGKWMTVAKFKGDYRVKAHNDLIDMNETVAVLRRAENLLDLALMKSKVL